MNKARHTQAPLVIAAVLTLIILVWGCFKPQLLIALIPGMLFGFVAGVFIASTKERSPIWSSLLALGISLIYFYLASQEPKTLEEIGNQLGLWGVGCLMAITCSIATHLFLRHPRPPR